MQDKIYTVTVSQLNTYIKQMMDANPILTNIWIKGEVSNCKIHYTGHIYLTLKDEGGVLKAIMFKSSASKLKFVPENGMKVMARGRVSVFERDGCYQLYIEEMQPDGVGALYIAFEQLKSKLEAEGLFDAKYKKKTPKFPERIGVVTATTGAAIRDIINVLSRRFPAAKVIIYPSLVQGPGAAEQIVNGISHFNKTNGADVLIVGRGGGSIEDLWPFNEEIVARAIFESKIPVISAVGHETDFTIADFVADMRAPTPSAAAELAVVSQFDIRERILSNKSRIMYSTNEFIKRRRMVLERLVPKNPKPRIDDLRMGLDSSLRCIIKEAYNIIQNKKSNLSSLISRLDALSPLSVLKRGYSIAKDKSGKPIKSVKDIKSGDDFILKLADGEKECRVL